MKKSGFTLIELITVVVIICILAAIAAPILGGMKTKAICSEAVTMMGTIRTAMQQYYAQYQKYPDSFNNGPCVLDIAADMQAIGLPVDVKATSPLQGTYFGRGCYWIYANIDNAHDPKNRILALPNPVDYGELPNDAVKHIDAENIVDNKNEGDCLIMYLATGQIKQYNITKSGYPSNGGPPS